MRLIDCAGNLPPQALGPAEVIEVDEKLRSEKLAPSTRASYAKAFRHILRWLHDAHGTQRLEHYVRKQPAPRPRNVTVTNAERAALLRAAKPHLRLLLLLCSDLAIRSGTAARLSPAHYNPETRLLTFTTKCNEKLTLPTTAEVSAMLAECDLNDPTPFVRQLWARDKHHGPPCSARGPTDALWRQFRELCASVGIQRTLRLHDLRRTAAVEIYKHTRDLRAAQALLGHKRLDSTVWYLDHNVTPVERGVLELIKLPHNERTA